MARELLDPYFEHAPLPKHGAGKVAKAGIQSLGEKHRSMVFNPQVYIAFSDGGYSPYDYLPESTSFFDKFEIPYIPTSRYACVPKNVASVRVMCMEPGECQWSQQSVMRALIEMIDKSPIGRFIRIHDQAFNRDAAQAGSLLGHLDTIDLSSASDSVSLDLVSKVFSGPLLRLLIATRSTHCLLPDGRTVRLEKFAPMGSACCFPVQTILYALLALRRYHTVMFGHVAVTRQSLFQCLDRISDDPYEAGHETFGAMRIYGDDIIIDGDVTSLLIDDLRSLGFKVNDSKSFYGQVAFRESCGGYYLFGKDVAPYQLKLKGVKSTMTPSFLAGLVEAANRAYEHGYYKLRDQLVAFAHWYPSSKRGELPRPLLYDDFVGIAGAPLISRFVYRLRSVRRPSKSHRTVPTNDNLVGLKSVMIPFHDYQRKEKRVLVAVSQTSTEPRDETYSYNVWMRSPGPDSSGDEGLVPKDHVKAIRRVWIPA
jgi:hypothetical protein